MKRLLLFLLIAGNSFFNFSQQSPEKRNILCASVMEDPATIIWKIQGMTNGMNYERCLTGNQSLGVGFSVMTSLKPTENIEPFSITRLNHALGLKGQVQPKQYLNRKKVLWPFLVYPFHGFQFNNVESAHTGYYLSESIFATNLNMERRQIDPNYAGTPTYTTTRKSVGAGFHGGFLCEKKYGLIIDCSLGIGLQYAWSAAQGKIINPNDVVITEQEFGLINSDVDNLSLLIPYFSSTFKIGWRF